LYYSKQIQNGTGYIVIYNEDWTPFQVIVVTSAAVTLGSYTEPVYSGNKLPLFLTTILNRCLNTMYVLEQVHLKTKQLLLTCLPALWIILVFKLKTMLLLKLFSNTPADNATGVSAYADLTITFDRDVLANAAGKLYVYEEVNNAGVLVETIDPTDATKVAVNGAVVTISRSVALKYNANYYVIIGAGAFTNTASAKKPYAGLTTTQGW
jgi:hypothetical protein